MAYLDKYGAEFSDDKKDLLEVPEDYSGVYEIPQGTTGVYWDAFKDCSKISAIVIPSSVDEFYDDCLDSVNVFSTCKKLTHFIVDSQNKTCFTIDGILCEKKTNVILAYPYAKEGEFLLPENILLTDSAEEGWQGALTTSPYILTRIQIKDTNPNYVVKDGALYNRSMDILIKVSPDITQYIMPDSVKMIANCAFWGCNKLRKIVFGSSLSDISSQELTLAEQLRGCPNLSSIEVSNFNEHFSANEHGFVYYHD